jgi:hypothetical protein
MPEAAVLPAIDVLKGSQQLAIQMEWCVKKFT